MFRRSFLESTVAAIAGIFAFRKSPAVASESTAAVTAGKESVELKLSEEKSRRVFMKFGPASDTVWLDPASVVAIHKPMGGFAFLHCANGSKIGVDHDTADKILEHILNG